MIEIWNKIDLLKEPINYDDLNKSEYPVVPIRYILLVIIITFSNLLQCFNENKYYLIVKVDGRKNKCFIREKKL